MVVFPLEQSSKTLKETSCPCSVGQDVFLSVLTLVQRSCLFFSSPGQAGLLFLFAFRFLCVCVSCYFSSPWVLADTLFMTVSQKEGSGTAKKGGDLGWLIPRGPVLHPFLPTPMMPLMHSVKEPRAAASPRLSPHCVSWVCSVPPLASAAAYIGCHHLVLIGCGEVTSGRAASILGTWFAHSTVKHLVAVSHSALDQSLGSPL